MRHTELNLRARRPFHTASRGILETPLECRRQFPRCAADTYSVSRAQTKTPPRGRGPVARRGTQCSLRRRAKPKPARARPRRARLPGSGTVAVVLAARTVSVIRSERVYTSPGRITEVALKVP